MPAMSAVEHQPKMAAHDDAREVPSDGKSEAMHPQSGAAAETTLPSIHPPDSSGPSAPDLFKQLPPDVMTEILRRVDPGGCGGGGRGASLPSPSPSPSPSASPSASASASPPPSPSRSASPSRSRPRSRSPRFENYHEWDVLSAPLGGTLAALLPLRQLSRGFREGVDAAVRGAHFHLEPVRLDSRPTPRFEHFLLRVLPRWPHLTSLRMECMKRSSDLSSTLTAVTHSLPTLKTLHLRLVDFLYIKRTPHQRAIREDPEHAPPVPRLLSTHLKALESLTLENFWAVGRWSRGLETLTSLKTLAIKSLERPDAPLTFTGHMIGNLLRRPPVATGEVLDQSASSATRDLESPAQSHVESEGGQGVRTRTLSGEISSQSEGQGACERVDMGGSALGCSGSSSHALIGSSPIGSTPDGTASPSRPGSPFNDATGSVGEGTSSPVSFRSPSRAFTGSFRDRWGDERAPMGSSEALLLSNGRFLPNLTSLSLSQALFSEVSCMLCCPNLTFLRLERLEGLQVLPSLPAQLQTLILNKLEDLEDSALVLPPLPDLTSLSVSNLGIRELITTGFGQLTSLKRLNLERLWRIRSLPPLDPLTHLKSLRIHECLFLKDVPTLGPLDQLTSLTLSSLPGAQWATSSDLSCSIRVLKLDGCRFLSGPANLPLLTELTSLQLITLDSDKALASLASLGSLREIVIEECKVAEEPRVAGLRHLTSLRLENVIVQGGNEADEGRSGGMLRLPMGLRELCVMHCPWFTGTDTRDALGLKIVELEGNPRCKLHLR